MVLFPKGNKPVAIPISGSDEVADVTGAGDTVIATYTAALAAGPDAESAVRLAWLEPHKSLNALHSHPVRTRGNRVREVAGQVG